MSSIVNIKSESVSYIKKGDNNCIYTLVTISDYHKTIVDHINIKDIKEMEYKDYNPSGCTALNDAIYETFSKELERGTKDLICLIITDGEENASKKYMVKDVRKIIDLATKVYNWDIKFIGANIDTIREGVNIGLVSNSCYQFSQQEYGNLTNITRSISADINNKIDSLKVNIPPNRICSIKEKIPPPLSPLKKRQSVYRDINISPIKFKLSPNTPVKSC